MVAMLTVLWFATALFVGFDGASGLVQFGVDVPWMPALGVSLKFAVDGYNVYFLLLTALLFPAVLACAWQTEEGRSPLYLGLLLALLAEAVRLADRLGKGVRTAPRDPIMDLDAIPFPAWDLVNIERYAAFTKARTVRMEGESLKETDAA